jgi:DNA-directed RNA polymerase alpha subunit
MAVLEALRPLDKDDRHRVLAAAGAYYGAPCESQIASADERMKKSSIQELGLSTGLEGALWEAGIHYIEEAACIPDGRLMRLKHVGSQRVKELRRKIAEYKGRLSGDRSAAKEGT